MLTRTMYMSNGCRLSHKTLSDLGNPTTLTVNSPDARHREHPKRHRLQLGCATASGQREHSLTSVRHANTAQQERIKAPVNMTDGKTPLATLSGSWHR